MNVTLVNKSTFSDESLQTIVDFLAPCYGEIGMPIRLVVKNKPKGTGTWGVCHWPTKNTHRRCIKPGEYSVTLNIGAIPGNYPHERIYKKRAGGYTATNLVDEIVHTMAHEFRHVEQFEACRISYKFFDQNKTFAMNFQQWERGAARYPSNSCEIDAEVVAHELLRAYRDSLSIRRAA
jgi:hypothetical protein